MDCGHLVPGTQRWVRLCAVLDPGARSTRGTQPSVLPLASAAVAPWSCGAGASLCLLFLARTLLKNVMFATVIGFTSPRGLAFSGRWGQGPGDLT